jgi:hypothetical protein
MGVYKGLQRVRALPTLCEKTSSLVMLWVVIEPIADGSPDTVFLTVILGFYSCAPLFLNSGGGKLYATSR